MARQTDSQWEYGVRRSAASLANRMAAQIERNKWPEGKTLWDIVDPLLHGQKGPVVRWSVIFEVEDRFAGITNKDFSDRLRDFKHDKRMVVRALRKVSKDIANSKTLVAS